MEILWRDLKYALKMLLKKPAFSLVAVVTLALGIGACTAIFTVVDAALLRGLPYKDPDRLFHLWETRPDKQFPRREASYPDYLDWQQNQVFEQMAAYTGGGVIMTGRGEPERLFAPSVSANFFSTLGVEALLGRSFQAGEDAPGSERLAILSYGLWQRRFGRDPAIIGQSLTLNGMPYTVVGILPQGFQFALRPGDLYTAYQPSQMQLARRFMHGTNVIARLKTGVSREQAESEMSAIAGRIEQQYNESHADTGIMLVPLHEEIVGEVKPVMLALLVAVGFVLLIACANVANLMLVRSAARQKEMAIRAALGAGRRRVIRQLLTESLALAFIGGAAGLLIAQWGVELLITMIPETRLLAMPYLKGVHIDLGVLAFAAGVTLLTGIVFGLAPALEASRSDLQEVLKEGGRSSAATARTRLRSLLVISEIALALVLLVGAALMMKSLVRLLEVDPGFDTKNLLTMRVSLPSSKFTEPGQRVPFYDQLLSRVKSIPGVKGAATVDVLPLVGGNTTRLIMEGEPVPPPGEEIEANIREISPDYFQVMGVPLIEGRSFDSRENSDSPARVIINKTLADHILPGRDPVGRRVLFSGMNQPPLEIIGVVGDEKVNDLDAEMKPVVYYSYRQDPSSRTSLVVRGASDPTGLIGAIRSELREMEPDLSLDGARTMEQMMAELPSTFMRRYPALLIGIFAAVALLLASVGIYGVISYSVSRQTHDIGLRMALGARASDILRMVLKQGLLLVAAGVGIGLAAAFALTRLMAGLLYGVSATDPLTFVVIPLVLAGVALGACFIPARKATRVDPMEALRYE